MTVAVRDGRALRALLGTSGPPLAEAHGDDGLTQRIWPIEDPDATDAITTLVGRLDTYLIDGHHRAAATALHRDHLAAGATGGVPGPAAWLLTALFGADQLLNRPFHREVLGIALRTFIAALGPQASWRDLEAGALADRDPDEIAVHGSDRWIAVRIPLDDDPILELDPARIDRYLLHQAMGLDPERRDGRVRYRPGSVFSAPGTDPGSSSSDDSVLFVAREVPVETVLDLADRGRVLPPQVDLLRTQGPIGGVPASREVSRSPILSGCA